MFAVFRLHHSPPNTPPGPSIYPKCLASAPRNAAPRVYASYSLRISSRVKHLYSPFYMKTYKSSIFSFCCFCVVSGPASQSLGAWPLLPLFIFFFGKCLSMAILPLEIRGWLMPCPFEKKPRIFPPSPPVLFATSLIPSPVTGAAIKEALTHI